MFGNRRGFLSLHAVLGIWKHGVGRVVECRAAQCEHVGAAAAAAIQCAVTLQFPLSPCKGASLTHPHEYSSTVKPVNAQFTAAIHAQGIEGVENHIQAEVVHGAQ